MTSDEQRQLIEAEQRVARLTAQLRDAEGQRDTLQAKLLDLAGASDQRFAGPR
jgi:outer membrane protein TolC